MQYQLAFGYFVGKKPNGWTNLLLLTVCLFIPVVGPLVMLGYRAEVIDRLLRDPDLRRHPDFQFDRFMDLLVRGAWPFLISLIPMVVLIPVMIAAMVGGAALGAATGEPVLAFVAGMAVYIVIGFGVAALTIPMVFHAEVANRFDLGGSFRFAVSFLKLVGGKAVVTYLVFSLLTIPLTLLGMLACFVGIYPAAVVATMAGDHLMVQLYLEYLSAGGEEVVKTPTDAERRRLRRRDEAEEDDGSDDEDDRGGRR